MEHVIVSRNFADDAKNREFLQEISSPVFVAAGADLEKVSSLQNSQGILAVVRKADPPGDLPAGEGDTLLILCDGIQDPGNLGTMIRIAVAFEADSVLLTGETADIYNPKVVRASIGTILDIPIYTCDAKELDRLKKEGYRLLAGRSQEKESKDITETKNVPGPVILAFGSEGKGVSPGISSRADGFFYIPICDGVESLNVAAAAAISMYVFRRT
jgi:TrmH family RNA methyltransferase